MMKPAMTVKPPEPSLGNRPTMPVASRKSSKVTTASTSQLPSSRLRLGDRRALVRKLADDEFKDVVERHHPADVAELVDDERQVEFVAAETLQELGPGALLGDRRGIRQQVADHGGTDQREIGPEALDRNHAEGTVRRALEDREPGMTGGDHLTPVHLIRVVEIQPDDPVAGCHELLGGDLVQAERAVHHAVFGGMQHPGSHPLVDHHPEFILGHGVLRGAPATEQP